ncbi:MAG: flavin reductase family protein [Bacteroidales bacterium]|nr:flavin reductase family protein [Bacteroidales bacterium]
MKTKLGPQRLILPFPTVLVVTGNMEKANIVTIAWISMLSGSPLTLGISVGQKSFTGEKIKENKDFTVNIATVEIMDEADFCGITSGRNTDKFEISGLTKIPSSYIQSPIIKECPINFECKLVEANIVGRTNHFIGEILETHVDTEKIEDANNKGSISIEAINPLIYFSGVREYRKLGDKAGDAYKTGKKLIG